ncbi:hypothetical protein C8J56DRAFT_1028180 [Mycena floridula]|nr:hypothetical protein C8J56DRAFT_1028180 [Mycena floridula]
MATDVNVQRVFNNNIADEQSPDPENTPSDTNAEPMRPKTPDNDASSVYDTTVGDFKGPTSSPLKPTIEVKTEFSGASKFSPQGTDKDDLDLLNAIPSMYRMLDLISEQSSGGLGAYVSLTRVNFKALDQLTVKPVGIYGSRESIVELLLNLDIVDNATSLTLISAKDDGPGPKLCSGLYFVRVTKKSGDDGPEQLYVVYWPEDMTWYDDAIDAVKRNRVTFMRYLTKITDQIHCFILPSEACDFVWKDNEETPKVFSLDDSHRLYTFEVFKTLEQTENVTMHDIQYTYTMPSRSKQALRDAAARARNSRHPRSVIPSPNQSLPMTPRALSPITIDSDTDVDMPSLVIEAELDAQVTDPEGIPADSDADVDVCGWDGLTGHSPRTRRQKDREARDGEAERERTKTSSTGQFMKAYFMPKEPDPVVSVSGTPVIAATSDPHHSASVEDSQDEIFTGYLSDISINPSDGDLTDDEDSSSSDSEWKEAESSATSKGKNRIPQVPALKRQRLAVPYREARRLAKQTKKDNREKVLKSALKDMEKIFESRKTEFEAGCNGLQFYRAQSIWAHLDMMIKGRENVDASSRAAEALGFSSKWGGRLVQSWTAAWINKHDLPKSQRAKLQEFTEKKMVPAAAKAYLQTIVDEEMPQGLKKYLELELFPHIHLKVAKGISIRTACCWLQAEGFRYTEHKKALYYDGHNRPDVIKYRQEVFIPAMDEYRKRMVEYTAGDVMKEVEKDYGGQRKLVLVAHDEMTAQANDGKPKSWVLEGEHALKKKGVGHGIHQSDVICSTFGHLPEASQTLEYGKNYEGYWDGDLFVKQLEQKIIPAFEKYHDPKEYQALIMSFIMARYLPARTQEQPFDGQVYTVISLKALLSASGPIELNQSLNEEAISALLWHGLESRHPRLCTEWMLRKEALENSHVKSLEEKEANIRVKLEIEFPDLEDPGLSVLDIGFDKGSDERLDQRNRL